MTFRFAQHSNKRSIQNIIVRRRSVSQLIRPRYNTGCECLLFTLLITYSSYSLSLCDILTITSQNSFASEQSRNLKLPRVCRTNITEQLNARIGSQLFFLILINCLEKIWVFVAEVVVVALL